MITIPEHFWSRMLDEFAKELRSVEQVSYFDGVAIDGGGIVTTLTIPNARLHEGRFEVTPDAMSQAGKHLRQHHLRRLAQIHTHPTDWTGHSSWDDARAYSQMPGAISVVLPNFGRSRPALEEAGVHLRTETGWQPVQPDKVAQYVRIVPSFFDFRVHPRSEHERQRVESPRRRSWWDIVAFWRW